MASDIMLFAAYAVASILLATAFDYLD